MTYALLGLLIVFGAVCLLWLIVKIVSLMLP